MEVWRRESASGENWLSCILRAPLLAFVHPFIIIPQHDDCIEFRISCLLQLLCSREWLGEKRQASVVLACRPIFWRFVKTSRLDNPLVPIPPLVQATSGSTYSNVWARTESCKFTKSIPLRLFNTSVSPRVIKLCHSISLKDTFPSSADPPGSFFSQCFLYS